MVSLYVSFNSSVAENAGAVPKGQDAAQKLANSGGVGEGGSRPLARAEVPAERAAALCKIVS